MVDEAQAQHSVIGVLPSAGPATVSVYAGAAVGSSLPSQLVRFGTSTAGARRARFALRTSTASVQRAIW